jgi:hypothetical protein
MRLFGWAGLGTLSIIMLLQLRGMDAPLRTPETPLGVVGYELAFTPARAEAMLSTWRSLDRLEALRVSLGFDVAFLLVYPWFLRRSISVVTSWRDQPGVTDRWTRTARWLTVAVVGCLPLDALENAVLWRMITSPPTAALTVTAGLAATIKFFLVAATLVWCMGALWTGWRSRRV